MSATVRRGRQQKGLSAAEAAWLTELSPKVVNKVIDRNELPKACRARGLGPAEVLYLVLRCSVGDALTADAKREMYTQVAALKLKDFDLCSTQTAKAKFGDIWLAGGMLRVDLGPACLKLSKRWKALDRAEQEVVSDPGIRRGEPVVRGTRVPVYMLADLFEQGADAEEILEDYPSLTAGKVRAALAYAQTHPRRGRPPKATGVSK